MRSSWSFLWWFQWDFNGGSMVVLKQTTLFMLLLINHIGMMVVPFLLITSIELCWSTFHQKHEMIPTHKDIFKMGWRPPMNPPQGVQNQTFGFSQPTLLTPRRLKNNPSYTYIWSAFWSNSTCTLTNKIKYMGLDGMGFWATLNGRGLLSLRKRMCFLASRNVASQYKSINYSTTA